MSCLYKTGQHPLKIRAKNRETEERERERKDWVIKVSPLFPVAHRMQDKKQDGVFLVLQQVQVVAGGKEAEREKKKRGGSTAVALVYFSSCVRRKSGFRTVFFLSDYTPPNLSENLLSDYV